MYYNGKKWSEVKKVLKNYALLVKNEYLCKLFIKLDII